MWPWQLHLVARLWHPQKNGWLPLVPLGQVHYWSSAAIVPSLSAAGVLTLSVAVVPAPSAAGVDPRGGGDGAIAPPPLGTLLSIFSAIVTKKSNRGPLKIKWTKSEFLFLRVGWVLYQILDSNPPTVEFVPNSAKWA